MPTELKGEALLDYYREAVRACHGDEAAKRTIIQFRRGWYYIESWVPIGDKDFYRGWGRNYRAAQLREMADELLERAKEEKAK